MGHRHLQRVIGVVPHDPQQQLPARVPPLGIAGGHEGQTL